jgi:hypothetical protein
MRSERGKGHGVNCPQTEAEVEALRRSVVRNRPFGTEAWAKATAAQLDD